MAALTMASSRSTAITGVMITEVTQKALATGNAEVFQGRRGKRDDQALLTGLPSPLRAWEYSQGD